MQTIMDIFSATWGMALAAAPWLVVGLIVAAFIKVYVPTAWLTKFMHGRGGVVKAAFIGAPLPLCSCGVIPAALALRRQGASRGSVMSFLVATPETGVDSVAVSYALLGPFLAIARPTSAILSAIATGLVGAAIPLSAEAGSPAVKKTSTAKPPEESGGCCSSKPASSCDETTEPKTSCGCASEEPKATSSCCASEESKPASSCCGADEPAPASFCCSSKTDTAPSRRPGLLASLVEAASAVLGDTMKWLLIGLLLAGTISVFIQPEQLGDWGSGLGVMILMAIVGIPMYICATASTPLAAGLLIAGLSPGAVLVFMLAGPATNVATLGVIRKEMGTRHMIAYLLTVSTSAILCGLATDAIASALSISAISQAQEAHHHHGMIPHWLAVACLVALMVLAIKPLRMKLLPAGRSASGADRAEITAPKPALDDRA